MKYYTNNVLHLYESSGQCPVFPIHLHICAYDKELRQLFPLLTYLIHTSHKEIYYTVWDTEDELEERKEDKYGALRHVNKGFHNLK